MFERMSGLDALEELQKHPNIDVYNKCNEILHKYFQSADNMDMNNQMQTESSQMTAVSDSSFHQQRSITGSNFSTFNI